METIYHYPPELLDLLIQTIPRLFRSKSDVVLFFEGAGVDRQHLRDVRAIVQTNKDSISKFEIARRVLQRINADGDAGLRARREIVKRVVEFEDFSSCWENNRLEAQGLVSRVQHVVGVKDSFTKMSTEREKERSEHRKQHQEKMERLQKHEAERTQIRNELYALFAETNPQKRGKALEGLLNRLFANEDISIREAFELCGDEGEGIVEQIDGVVEIDGHVYLVEMKWWKEALGTGDVAPHLVRLFGRSEARGIFISNSGYTEPAIKTCRDALQQKPVVLCTLEEIVILLDAGDPLKDLLKEKILAAVVDKNPFHRRGP